MLLHAAAPRDGTFPASSMLPQLPPSVPQWVRDEIARVRPGVFPGPRHARRLHHHHRGAHPPAFPWRNRPGQFQPLGAWYDPTTWFDSTPAPTIEPVTVTPPVDLYPIEPVTVTPEVTLPPPVAMTAPAIQSPANVVPTTATPGTSDWFSSDVLPLLTIAGSTLIGFTQATHGLPIGGGIAAGPYPGGVASPAQLAMMTPAQRAQYLAQQSSFSSPSLMSSLFGGSSSTMMILSVAGLALMAVMVLKKENR